MIPATERPAIDEAELEALLAFDRALAAGDNPAASAGSAVVLATGPRMPASAGGGLAPRRCAIVRAARSSSGGSRSSANWAAADSGLCSWQRIRSSGARSRSRSPGRRCWSRPRSGGGFCERRKRLRASTTRTSCRFTRLARTGRSATSPRRTARGRHSAEWLRLQTAPVPIRVACRLVADPGRGGCARPRAGHPSPRSETGQHLAPATARRWIGSGADFRRAGLHSADLRLRPGQAARPDFG